MATRWRTSDETLTASHMGFFPMDTLDETATLSSGETLEALQSCLDPSILSLFEDTPTIDTKGIDESEATLLTALTEILDNVDDENLSPFDTLPDSDLLSGHKGREHSPLRRLFCLSRSPPEKDTLCGARPSSIGKSLPGTQVGSLQRSDGEEEEDGSLTLSPLGLGSSDNNLLDWGSLTVPLPVTFEQEGENGVSVSLKDLVRQMHPYCMAFCVDNEEGEQLLPGILLEVVDQGENGEPILAIPDVGLPVSLPHKEQSTVNEHRLSNEDDVASDCSEHIVVDDDDEDITLTEAPVKAAAHVMPDVKMPDKDEMIIKRQKEEIKEKLPSRRKRKKKCKEQSHPNPVEGRVLRSGTVTIRESPKKPDKRRVRSEKKQNLPKVPLVSAPSSLALKPDKPNPCQAKAETEISTTTTLSPETKVQVATSVSLGQEAALSNDGAEPSHPSCSPTAAQSLKPNEKPKQPDPPKEMVEDLPAAPSTVATPASLESPAAAPSPVPPPVSEALPSVVPAAAEPKPKPLSLAEYRRLRQQKKPTPVENQENLNSSKWPSLPELPKELPPIPCLPNPDPRDPRRPNFNAAKKEEDEVRPAWQPRGPCAPPTPEALLVRPAYMISSSSRVSAATPAPKTQQTTEHKEPSVTQKPPPPAPANSAKTVPPHQHTTAVSSVPRSSGSPASLNPDTRCALSADGKYSPALPGERAGEDVKPQPQPVSPKSAELTKTCPETTTGPIKAATAAPMSAPSSSRKIPVVFQKGSEVTAPTLIDIPVTSGGKPTKPTANGTRVASAARPTDSRSLKTEHVLETKGKPTTAVKPQRTKSPTQELVEAFTSEIGIEAADLTSLLEQFEESQAKEEQCMLEVSGRAAAVGNSSVDVFPEKTAVERVRANDLSSTAALTPPGTPPHQMWKPLAPVALLRKSKASEASKSSPARVIQIDARPLPAVRSRSRPTPATVTPEVACMDHDYCLPNKGPGEPVKRWNVKQQPFITIKPIKATATATQSPHAAPALSVKPTTVTTKTQDMSLTEPLDHRTDEVQRSSVLETPDASPAWQEADDAVKEGSPKTGPFEGPCRRQAASRTPSPRSVPKERTGGQSRKRSHRSPSPMSSGSESDSHSSRSRSRSHSPSSKKRYRPRHSSSSSSSSRSSSRSSASCSPPRRRRYSYSSSRSGSWSRSRSRSRSQSRSQSRSPQRRSGWSRSRRLYRASYRPSYDHSANTNMEKMKKGKEKAIEERRVVYVGRIRGTMTQKELRERFSFFGDIEDCTLHFRDHGDNYGFVTYSNTKDAFTAIENGSKLRKPDELPFDLCFGGRRQFCRTSYADLDSNREYDPLSAKGKFHALDFDTLLKQAQQNLKR